MVYAHRPGSVDLEINLPVIIFHMIVLAIVEDIEIAGPQEAIWYCGSGPNYLG